MPLRWLATMADGTVIARRVRLAAGSFIRAFPLGAGILRLRRRALAAVQRRARPVRPPLHSPEHVAALSAIAHDHPFITGNGLAARCRYVINYDELYVNEGVDNDWWFCRTDFIEHFFARHEPRNPYVLFSHNSDRCVDGGLRRFLGRRCLRAWFATNADLRHPKLHAFPLGIANPRWRHGDGATILRVSRKEVPKETLFDASYDISTYRPAREYCRDQTGIEPAVRTDFDTYVRNLASSYFCIAPRGNGIDTHRTWEALALATVPIVTRSLLTEQHPDLPFVVLEDWSEFHAIDFSPALYERLMGAWDPASLELDRYLDQVRKTLLD
jgi:hypothetical protein